MNKLYNANKIFELQFHLFKFNFSTCKSSAGWIIKINENNNATQNCLFLLEIKMTKQVGYRERTLQNQNYCYTNDETVWGKQMHTFLFEVSAIIDNNNLSLLEKKNSLHMTLTLHVTWIIMFFALICHSPSNLITMKK